MLQLGFATQIVLVLGLKPHIWLIGLTTLVCMVPKDFGYQRLFEFYENMFWNGSFYFFCFHNLCFYIHISISWFYTYMSWICFVLMRFDLSFFSLYISFLLCDFIWISWSYFSFSFLIHIRFITHMSLIMHYCWLGCMKIVFVYDSSIIISVWA